MPLVDITHDSEEETKIIEKYVLQYTDSVECLHSKNDEKTRAQCIEFAKKCDMLMTGAVIVTKKLLLIDAVDMPDWAAELRSSKRPEFPTANT